MHETAVPRHPESQQFTLLEARGLSYRYPNGQAALSGVDLTIYEGDRIALIGHNGAGKTTLVKHLNGLYAAQSGELLFHGEPLQDENLKRVRLDIGVLFQDPDDQLFCNTLYEDIAFGPLNQGFTPEEADALVHESARKVGMEELLFKAPHNLSYGQKKRAALATVLSMHPDALILDEPTANLDPRQEEVFTELIREFPGTLIVISHDLTFLYGICDRAVVMEKGGVHHDYTMKELASQRKYLREHGLESSFRFTCCGGHHHEAPTHAHPHSHGRSSSMGAAGGQSDDRPIARQKSGDSDAPLIHLLDYSYRHPDGAWGVRDIHLHVNEGESIAVAGENGAGKSTLARCILGITEGRGSYAFDGKLVTKKNRKALWRQVGMVFQNPADQLFCPSCWEEVAFGPRQMGLPKNEVEARVEEALQAVRLTGYERRAPHHLSSGERKRLAIAAALSIRSRVLILDEPTANLDAGSEDLLFEIISHLPVTKILISHDMALMMALCERAIVLHQGRIIRDYACAELERDVHLTSINGIDYTLKNACRDAMLSLQEGAA